MTEENLQVKETTQPEVGNTPTTEPAENNQQVQPDDLLNRVTKFVETESPANKPEEKINEELFNDVELRQKIDSIEDEGLRTQFASLRKSLMRGANDKFQEIAEFRKELQNVKDGLQPKGWSPERIKQLMNDPEFLSAAQQVAGTPQQEEDEYVPESVKNKLKELDDLKEQVGKWQSTLTRSQQEQAHQTLKGRYADYNQEKIDEIHKDVLEKKIVPSYDDIYKVLNYVPNINKAYKMGRKDALEGIGEKEQASSFEGLNQTPNSEIKPEKEETNKQLWSRIADKAVTSMKRK